MKKTKKQNGKTLRLNKAAIASLTPVQAQTIAGGAKCANNLKQLSLA